MKYDNDPLVSIIIPIYNVEKYLEQCLYSVVNQKYRNIEIICVDDGSLDNSIDILNDFNSNDDRVKIIRQENGGLSKARNTGIDASSGLYLYFLDSDDWMDLNAIYNLINAALEYKVSVISGSVVCYNEDTKLYNPYKKNRKVGLINLEKSGLYSLEVVVCNKLYHSSIFDKFRFTEGMYYEDEDLYWRLFSSLTLVVSLDCNVYFYRKRKGSITSGDFLSKKHQDGYITILKHAGEIVEKNPKLKKYLIKCAMKYQRKMRAKGIVHDKYDEYIYHELGVRSDIFYRVWQKIKWYLT